MTEAEISKAISALRAAQLLLREGFTDEAVASSYYAMFHMARALLSWQQVSLPRTHSGLIAIFSEQYVKSGQLPKSLGRYFNELEDARLIADYSADIIALKFGELPAWADERLTQASDAQLDVWVVRILTADSLEGLLAD
jgi:uncharacterized protein (UPF0332 family)